MKIIEIILWILFLLSIAIGLWYLFGNSPTFEQAIVIFLITSVFAIAINVSRGGMKLNYVEKKVCEIERNSKNSFKKMKNDINLIKTKLRII